MSPIPNLFCELYLNSVCFPPPNAYKKNLAEIIRHASWEFKIKQAYPDYLPEEVSHVRFCNDFDEPNEQKKEDIVVFFRALSENGRTIDDLLHEIFSYEVVYLEDSTSSAETLPSGDCTDESGATSSQNWMLPCKAFDNIWENLYFKDDTKAQLLRYAQTCLKLGSSGVDANIILSNRLILLHGPPGTGKTTICRALAQKLSIRMANDYPTAQLVEVNCHSLFSKWFSESGKLVSRMFSTIRQYAEDPKTLVVILIDEVESLTAARQAAMNSNEPSDAIRVVNAVLNQLDILRFMGNVLTLATSNLTGAIDCAFTDRADLIKYVGLPDNQERRLILESCFRELERTKIVLPRQFIGENDETMEIIIQASEGLSGRTLRKLPVIALSEICITMQTSIPHSVFMKALAEATSRLKKDRSLVS